MKDKKNKTEVDFSRKIQGLGRLVRHIRNAGRAMQHSHMSLEMSAPLRSMWDKHPMERPYIGHHVLTTVRLTRLDLTHKGVVFATICL